MLQQMMRLLCDQLLQTTLRLLPHMNTNSNRSAAKIKRKKRKKMTTMMTTKLTQVHVDYAGGEAYDIRVRGHRVRVDQAVRHG